MFFNFCVVFGLPAAASESDNQHSGSIVYFSVYVGDGGFGSLHAFFLC